VLATVTAAAARSTAKTKTGHAYFLVYKIQDTKVYLKLGV
jgi:hypothetical protein